MKRRRISYWYPIAKAVARFIDGMKDSQGHRLLGDIPVTVGSMGAARTFPMVEVTWNNENVAPLPIPTEGEIELWVTVGVRGDEKDPEDAYRLQDGVQRRILNGLQGRELPEAIFKETEVGTRLTVSRIWSDYEQNRPVMLAMIELIVNWKQP